MKITYHFNVWYYKYLNKLSSFVKIIFKCRWITHLNLYSCCNRVSVHYPSVSPEMKQGRVFVWISSTRLLPSWLQFSFRSSWVLWQLLSPILHQCAERGCMTSSCGSRTTTGAVNLVGFHCRGTEIPRSCDDYHQFKLITFINTNISEGQSCHTCTVRNKTKLQECVACSLW